MIGNDRRGRRHADRRDTPVRSVEPHQLLFVIVPVQHQLGAVLGDERAEHRPVDQPLHVMPPVRDRRMMDQHDAKQRLARRARSGSRPAAPVARRRDGRRHERSGRQRRREADDCQRSAPAHEGEALSPASGEVDGDRRACTRPSAARLRSRRGGYRRRDCPARASRARACPRVASQRAAPANSVSSETLTRSPVTAMWSGACACMSVTTAASTSAWWWRCRFGTS